MKKISLLVLLICFLLFAGCGEQEIVNDEVTSNNQSIDDVEDLQSKVGTLKCTRSATANNAEPFFNYTLDYKDDEILRIDSIEGIKSSDSAILDEYEKAYKDISSHYEGLKYYDVHVIRETDKVTWNSVINYEKVDIDALVNLEGETDNIFEDGKAKLSLWLDLAKKVGTTCTEE